MVSGKGKRGLMVYEHQCWITILRQKIEGGNKAENKKQGMKKDTAMSQKVGNKGDLGPRINLCQYAYFPMMWYTLLYQGADFHWNVRNLFIFLISLTSIVLLLVKSFWYYSNLSSFIIKVLLFYDVVAFI